MADDTSYHCARHLVTPTLTFLWVLCISPNLCYRLVCTACGYRPRSCACSRWTTSTAATTTPPGLCYWLLPTAPLISMDSGTRSTVCMMHGIFIHFVAALCTMSIPITMSATGVISSVTVPASIMLQTPAHIDYNTFYTVSWAIACTLVAWSYWISSSTRCRHWPRSRPQSHPRYPHPRHSMPTPTPIPAHDADGECAFC